MPAPALAVRHRYLIVVPRPMLAVPRKYSIVVPRPKPTAPCRYLIAVPSPMPEAPLVVHRRYLIDAPGRCPRRRALCIADT